MSKREQIKELKTRLRAIREQCKTCKVWGCGHFEEPMYDLENAIVRLKKGGVA